MLRREVWLYPSDPEGPYVRDDTRIVAAIERENLEDYAREGVVQVVPHSHQLLHVAILLEDRKVAVVRYVAPILAEDARPAASTIVVVVLKDVSVGQSEALE